MRNRIGPPVEGDDFIGKTKELNFAWEILLDGNSLLLAAPRRVGKTSFAKKLVERAKKENWRTLSVNLESIKNEQTFIVGFIQDLKRSSWLKSLSHKMQKRLEELLSSIDFSIEIDDIKTNVGWNSKKEKIFKELEGLFDHNKNTLIFIDELGVFLNKYEEQEKIKDAEFFLNWLRSIRQKTNSKIRWVFCSSIGVRNFTNRYQISYTINDIEPFEIQAFDQETARLLINKLANTKNISISKENTDFMLQKLEWYLPFYIQLLFKEIYTLHSLSEAKINENLITKAFENLANKSYLDTWDERLKYYYEKETIARKILNHLSVTEQRKRKQLFDLTHNINHTEEYTTNLLGDTLRMLINDGYLMQTPDHNYRFRSPLLKLYWYNKFIK